MKDDQLPFSNLLQGDGEVCVHHQFLTWDRSCLLKLGAKEETSCSKKLELGLDDPTPGQEPVHEVHGETEYLRLAAELLAHLQHPVGDDLPHMRLYLELTRPDVVWV